MILLILVVLVVVTYLSGRIVIFKLTGNEMRISESGVLSLVAGFGCLAFLIYLAGVLGYASFIASTLILGFLFITGLMVFIQTGGKWKIRESFNIKFRKLSRLDLFLLLIILILILFNLFRNFRPPIDHDSIESYLSIPKWYLMQGKVTDFPTTFWNNTPQYTQMLSLAGLSFKSIYLPQLITGWLPGILCAVIIFLIAGQFRLNTTSSLLAALIFYSSPTLLWINTTNKPDLLWTLFDLSALLVFFKVFNYSENLRKKSYYILIGMFLGFGFGTKYQSMLTLVIILLLLLYKLMLIHKNNILLLIREYITYLSLIMFFMILMSSPNMIMNYMYHKNPFYPLFAELKVNSSEISIINQLNNTSGLSNLFAFFAGKNYFLTKNILFNDYPFGGISLALIPLAFFSTMKKGDILLFLGIFIIYAAGMIYIKPAYSRHIFPSLAFLSVLAAAGLYFILQNFPKFKFVFLFLFLMSVVFNAEDRIISFVRNDIKLISGRESEEEYLDRNLFSTPTHMDRKIMDYVNSMVDIKDKILLLYYGRTFYIDRFTVFDSYLPEPFVFSERDPGRFIQNLGKNGIQYIWYNKNAFGNLSYDAVRRESYASTLLTENDFQAKYLDVVLKTEDEYLFKIKDVY